MKVNRPSTMYVSWCIFYESLASWSLVMTSLTLSVPKCLRANAKWEITALKDHESKGNYCYQRSGIQDLQRGKMSSEGKHQGNMIFFQCFSYFRTAQASTALYRSLPLCSGCILWMIFLHATILDPPVYFFLVNLCLLYLSQYQSSQKSLVSLFSLYDQRMMLVSFLKLYIILYFLQPFPRNLY